MFKYKIINYINNTEKIVTALSVSELIERYCNTGRELNVYESGVFAWSVVDLDGGTLCFEILYLGDVL